MSESKNIRMALNKFSLSGVGGLIPLVLIVIVSFSLGGLFLGGEKPSVLLSHDGLELAADGKSEPTVWTCSMHPQIRLPKPGKCPICFMDLIPVETSPGEELGLRQLRLSETAKKLAQITTAPVIRGFAQTEVRMVGKIAYDETRISYITAWVPGRLDRLYADFTGVAVSKGEHLVDMYSPELLAAQEELLQALSVVKALDRSASTMLKSTAATTVRAAREKLRLSGLSVEQIQSVEADGEVPDHITINAPIGGVVIHKNAWEGMYVETGNRIYTIADLTKLWVIFEAYESDLPWLRYGQQVSFTSPSFPGMPFEGVISFIDPVVDPETRTVHVRAIVDNENGILKPDMFVRGIVKSRIDGAGNVVDEYLAGQWISPMHPEVVKDGPGKCDVCGMDLVPVESLGYSGKPLADKETPLLIPISAPLITGKRAIVYVEIPNDEGPLFEGREIELGPRAGDFYVVKSGIAEGELVVTNGTFKIDSELQIQAKPSMMSPTGEGGVADHQHDAIGSAVGRKTTSETGGPTAENHEGASAITPVYKAYFEVQMALAADDLEEAKLAAARVSLETKNVDVSFFSRSGHGRWMGLSARLIKHASSINGSENMESARDSFFDLANVVIELEDSFGHAENRQFYLTFCPMANGNKGAYWLQTVDTVYNSFYGASMLRCGEIKKPLAGMSTPGTE